MTGAASFLGYEVTVTDHRYLHIVVRPEHAGHARLRLASHPGETVYLRRGERTGVGAVLPGERDRQIS